MHVLYDLCNWHLMAADHLRTIVDDVGVSLRLESIGADHQGRDYFILEDGRLYSVASIADGIEEQAWNLLAMSTSEYEAWILAQEATPARKRTKKDAALLSRVKAEYDEWIKPMLSVSQYGCVSV